MNWIPHPTILKGALTMLEPLAQAHFESLLRIGGQSEIWTHLPFNGTDAKKLEIELRSALLQRAQGLQYPFAILDRKTDTVIGSTRLFDLHPEHKKLEIGWTWYDPAWWGTGHNTDCKLLLFGFCFEVLQVNRIQLKTRDTNKRSQAAIQKAGGIFEGVLRCDRVMPDGAVRDTMVYSIIRDEWPLLKEQLRKRLAGCTTGDL
jgi:RimJ/RimL family protein N-acetyltransferase